MPRFQSNVGQQTPTTISTQSPLKTTSLKLHITHLHQLNQILHYLLTQYPKIHILLNNPTISIQHDTQNISYQQSLKQINLTLNPPFSLPQTLPPQIIDNPTPSIINLSSLLPFIPNKTQHHTSYQTSKPPLTILTKTLPTQSSTYPIKLNPIPPPYITTIQTQNILNHNTQTNTTPIQ
ncbi:SDR family NAD(P)-dependent oxidoreductase, partial [Staphylococcus epidermidis]|uniref:SDR family NAD(P)-dependent oxidoreductase n=1 Tax=Staphylococcus epidermidis TaxID=1282 RepID=UPI0037DA79D4